MKRILSLLIALSLAMIVTHSLKNDCVMASDQQGTESTHKSPKKTTAKDTVCGMTVKKDKASKLKHDGVNYYFCSQKCEDTFKKDPSKYAKKVKPKKTGKETGTKTEPVTETEEENND